MVSQLKKKSVFFISFIFYFLALLQAQDALLLYRSREYEQAIDTCKNEIKRNPKNLDSYVILSWALVGAGKYQEALDWSQKGRQLSIYDPRLIEIQAEALFYLGKNEEALKYFQNYISYAPNGVRQAVVYYFMGEIYLRLSKFRHADMAFSAALQLNSLNSEWWARLGYARERAKENRYSLEAYNRALELNKNLIDAQKGKERLLKNF
ncbi:tetratricopeptide repeat protein [Treponema phagedenis]|uniref:Tetratricopeptide repeat protein n=1 Tax=Treponema phagedenis TaxID=162 RepID=A0A0B7GUJ3_TREPH|nr:tetratricopeptide repeat protein [Treponema phagedenis]QEJ93844.1 tetratricopeptide repeat protein [Treponema phagedenis]QEJ96602.1 tetratricopeptide repeat protein [Treponema phagedenis]QEJ99769.1 tetratricopeptide repeat protein [Treponema phagedenis]QEK02388.1 tetratricopeptide repeat protein [Treponema phagedenis]